MKYTFSNKLGLAVIEPNIFYDFRGEYIETWNKQNYENFRNILLFLKENYTLNFKLLKELI